MLDMYLCMFWRKIESEWDEVAKKQNSEKWVFCHASPGRIFSIEINQFTINCRMRVWFPQTEAKGKTVEISTIISLEYKIN